MQVLGWHCEWQCPLFLCYVNCTRRNKATWDNQWRTPMPRALVPNERRAPQYRTLPGWVLCGCSVRVYPAGLAAGGSRPRGPGAMGPRPNPPAAPRSRRGTGLQPTGLPGRRRGLQEGMRIGREVSGMSMAAGFRGLSRGDERSPLPAPVRC